MREAKGNLWTHPSDFVIITTNGFVKVNGECVMGRGCANEANKMFPGLALFLGKAIKEGGNIVRDLGRWQGLPTTPGEVRLIAFPVKHNWWEKADIMLINSSVGRLLDLIDIHDPAHRARWVMPRPGCGNGKLDWEEVEPLLRRLPDNVTVITF